jgi:hypothetical protein
MPLIIIQAHTPDGTLGEVTLAERVVPTEQHNDHYIAQLIERVSWALVDAERLETRASDSHRAGPTRAETERSSPVVVQLSPAAKLPVASCGG